MGFSQILFVYFILKLSAVQLLKLRARFLWRVSYKSLLGWRFDLKNGFKLPRFFMFGTAQLYISLPNYVLPQGCVVIFCRECYHAIPSV